MQHVSRLAWPIASGALSAALWTLWAVAGTRGMWALTGLADVGIVVVSAGGVKWYLDRSERDKFIAFAAASGIASAAVSFFLGGS